MVSESLLSAKRLDTLKEYKRNTAFDVRACATCGENMQLLDSEIAKLEENNKIETLRQESKNLRKEVTEVVKESERLFK